MENHCPTFWGWSLRSHEAFPLASNWILDLIQRHIRGFVHARSRTRLRQRERPYTVSYANVSSPALQDATMKHYERRRSTLKGRKRLPPAPRQCSRARVAVLAAAHPSRCERRLKSFKPETRLRRLFKDLRKPNRCFFTTFPWRFLRFMAFRGQNPAWVRRNMHHPISRKASRPPSRMPSSTSKISCHMAASPSCCIEAVGAQNTCCSPDFPLFFSINQINTRDTLRSCIFETFRFVIGMLGLECVSRMDFIFLGRALRISLSRSRPGVREGGA